MHTATIAKRLHGRYLVICPEGCNLGTSASQATREDAERRVKLHQDATTPLGLAVEDGSSFKHPLRIDADQLSLSALRKHVQAMHQGQTVRGRKPPRTLADLCAWHWEIHYRMHLDHIHEGPWIKIIRDRHGRRNPLAQVKPRGYWTGEQPVTRAELRLRWQDKLAAQKAAQ